MKTFLTYFVQLFCLYTGKTFSQTAYKFIIDKQSYHVDETKLNDYFGMVFNELVESRRAKQRDFDLWVNSYKRYKEMASNGTSSWEIYYDKIVNYQYSGVGASDADLGLDNGKTAKIDPNKKRNHSSRMAYLNGLLAKYVTNNYTQKRIQ